MRDEKGNHMMWPHDKNAQSAKMKSNWLDLGMSHPLTLGMAHPLTDRLETLATEKVNKTTSRLTTTALVVGATLLSAPLTIAEAQPEDTPKTQLEDSVVKGKKVYKSVNRHTATVTHDGKPSKSTIRIHRTNDDGLHRFDIKIDGDKIEAYKLCKDGKREKIALKDIKGYDAEKAKNSKSWSFDVDDNNNLVFNAHAKSHKNAKWMGDKKRTVRVLSVDKDHTHLDKAGHERHEDHDITIHMNHDVDIEDLKGLESLKNLKGLEKLEALVELKGLKELKGLESLEELKALSALGELEQLEALKEMGIMDGKGVNKFVFKMESDEFLDGDVPFPPDAPRVKVFTGENKFPVELHGENFSHFTSKDGKSYVINKGGKKVQFHHYGPSEGETQLVVAQSMLDSAEKMLENIEGEEKELRNAKRDLERARRSLEKASKKMKAAKKAAAKEAKGKYPAID